MSTTYNVQYNIPRVQVQLPGRQNRLADGEFRISPSMTEVVVFSFGNQDGVPLNLRYFTLQFVVWKATPLASATISRGQSEVLLNKKIFIDDPYASMVEMLLTEEETNLLGNHTFGNRLYWSLFAVNDEGQVFPMQVSSKGGRYGTLQIDVAAGMPIAELIRFPGP
jgi:hypothetical protein